MGAPSTPEARLTDLKAAGNILAAVSQLLDQVDWHDVARQCERAESVLPITEPTAYRDHGDTLRRNGRLMRVTATYVDTLRALHEEAGG
jgi:hypothetical protein